MVFKINDLNSKVKRKLFFLVTYGLLFVTNGYLVVTPGYLIAGTGYFWLLLATTGSSF